MGTPEEFWPDINIDDYLVSVSSSYDDGGSSSRDAAASAAAAAAAAADDDEEKFWSDINLSDYLVSASDDDADSEETTTSGDSRESRATQSPPVKKRSLSNRSCKGKRGDREALQTKSADAPSSSRKTPAAAPRSRKTGSPFQKATPLEDLIVLAEKRLLASGKNERPFFPESVYGVSFLELDGWEHDHAVSFNHTFKDLYFDMKTAYDALSTGESPSVGSKRKAAGISADKRRDEAIRREAKVMQHLEKKVNWDIIYRKRLVDGTSAGCAKCHYSDLEGKLGCTMCGLESTFLSGFKNVCDVVVDDKFISPVMFRPWMQYTNVPKVVDHICGLIEAANAASGKRPAAGKSPICLAMDEARRIMRGICKCKATPCLCLEIAYLAHGERSYPDDPETDPGAARDITWCARGDGDVAADEGRNMSPAQLRRLLTDTWPKRRLAYLNKYVSRWKRFECLRKVDLDKRQSIGGVHSSNLDSYETNAAIKRKNRIPSAPSKRDRYALFAIYPLVQRLKSNEKDTYPDAFKALLLDIEKNGLGFQVSTEVD